MTTLQELLIDEIHELLSGERCIADFLIKLIEKVNSANLRTAVEEQEQLTQRQISDLENLLRHLGQPSLTLQIPPLESLILVCNLKMSQMETPQLRDTYIASSLQRIKYYEISSYTIVHTHAVQTAMTGTAELLLQMLEEERQLSEQLTCIPKDADGVWSNVENVSVI